jgi:hypothetical protein
MGNGCEKLSEKIAESSNHQFQNQQRAFHWFGSLVLLSNGCGLKIF